MTCFERILENMHQRLEKMQREGLEHEYIKRSIEMKDVAVFFISKKSVKNKRRYEECEFAFSLNKVMYAVVKEGTRWRRFKKFPWRKVYHYSDRSELKGIMRDLFADISLIHAAGGA